MSSRFFPRYKLTKVTLFVILRKISCQDDFFHTPVSFSVFHRHFQFVSFFSPRSPQDRISTATFWGIGHWKDLTNQTPSLKSWIFCTYIFCNHVQGSPNQAKWATSSPWFQCNRPISVKKRSFSRPVNLFKSVFFSPIIILFFQYSHKRSSHVPEMWPIQGLMFNILFQTH